VALRLRHARTPERQLDGADVDAVRQEAAGAFVTEVVAMQIDLPEFLEIDASAAFVFGTDNGEYMELRHHVPAARMTRRYYWRWWYWKGIARARMQDLHPVSERGLDLRRVPHVARSRGSCGGRPCVTPLCGLPPRGAAT